MPTDTSEMMYSFKCNSLSTSSEYNTTTDDESVSAVSSNCNINMRKGLFYAARYLADLIEKSPPLDAPWPPTADHFSKSEILKMIPPDLLNFLAWLLGDKDPFF